MQEIRVSGGSLVALVITLFFGPIGAFFAYWLLAGDGIFNALIKAIGWAVLIAICTASCAIAVGFILTPLAWIWMIYSVFRAARNVVTF